MCHMSRARETLLEQSDVRVVDRQVFSRFSQSKSSTLTSAPRHGVSITVQIEVEVDTAPPPIPQSSLLPVSKRKRQNGGQEKQASSGTRRNVEYSKGNIQQGYAEFVKRWSLVPWHEFSPISLEFERRGSMTQNWHGLHTQWQPCTASLQ